MCVCVRLPHNRLRLKSVFSVGLGQQEAAAGANRGKLHVVKLNQNCCGLLFFSLFVVVVVVVFGLTPRITSTQARQSDFAVFQARRRGHAMRWTVTVGSLRSEARVSISYSFTLFLR